MSDKTNILAFERKLIKGLYHDENVCHLIIGFPETSKYKDFIWNIPIDRIRYNTADKEDPIVGFNEDKCWIEVDSDYRFRLFELINHETDDIPVTVALDIEEMSWRLKPKFPYLDPESNYEE